MTIGKPALYFSWTIFLFTGIGIGLLIGMAYYGEQGTESHTPIKAPESQIMSIRELQTALNAKGHSRYKCDIDGKIGPQTTKAWDNYICDQYAKKEFDRQ